MNPTETVLLAFGLALALVGAGYWLGRKLPPLRGGQSQRVESARPVARRPVPSRYPAGPQADRNSRDRLQREIDARLQVMRRARESAEPWQPPAVDQVSIRTCESAYAAWFADTTVEPDAPRRGH